MNDQEPAFPRDHAADGHNGMSLRDYFAAKAMQAAATNPAGADGLPLTNAPSGRTSRPMPC